MSIPTEATNTTAVPVNTSTEGPSHIETPVIVNTQEHSNNGSTGVPDTTIASKPTPAKVTPIQRINSVYNKAKQTINEVISDAQRNVNEKSTSTVPGTAVGETSESTAAATPEKKVGTHKNTWKDILNRAKGFKSTSATHSAAQEQPTVVTNIEDTGAPIPPPKDNVAPEAPQHSSGSPIVDQLKRNATLLATFILQKKKEYTEKKSSDNIAHQQQSTTVSSTNPGSHDETGATHAEAPTTATNINASKPSSSPLVRRISQLVNSATANINKRRDTKKADPNITSTTSTAPPSAAVVTEEAPVTNNETINTA